MAASKSSFTLLHFSLIFFVMVSIILGVATYLGYKERGEAYQKIAAVEKDAQTARNASKTYVEEIRVLKELVGHVYDSVGINDRGNVNTVIGAMEADMALYGGTLRESTYKDTIRALRQELDNSVKEVAQLTATIEDMKTHADGLLVTYRGMADQHDTANRTAQQELAQRITANQESLKGLNTMIADLQTEIDSLKTERRQILADHSKVIADKDEVIGNLDRQVVRLTDFVKKLQQVSFEEADGVIRRVEGSTKLVYINRGSDDYLPVRTTFSVYNKGHHGVGRGQEHIKGTIEVTRIVGPDLAEARILEDTLADPIAPGDPIFTPLWTPGRQERVAFVGFIDIDGDGHSDRAMIESRVRAAGAKITSWVDDEGVRHGGKLDMDTRYLVVGDMEPPDDPARKRAYEEMSKHHIDMLDEARQHGVTVVNLHDFAAWIGASKLRTRVWRPGDPSPRRLKSGAASTAVNQTIGDRSASGTTAGVYGRGGKVNQPTSSGQTSKIFGGGKP